MNKEQINEIALRVAEETNLRLNHACGCSDCRKRDDPAKILKFAHALLEAIQREAVPHCWECETTDPDNHDGEDQLVICYEKQQMEDYRDESGYAVTPLFTAPPAAPSVTEWFPIETAPKDGQCLLWVDTDDGGEVMVLQRDSNGNWLYEGEPTFCHNCYINPTYWAPLPPAPSEVK